MSRAGAVIAALDDVIVLAAVYDVVVMVALGGVLATSASV